MSVCLRCAAPFNCAMMGEIDGPCWCTLEPRLLPVPGVGASCYCPQCLKVALDMQKAGAAAPPSD